MSTMIGIIYVYLQDTKLVTQRQLDHRLALATQELQKGSCCGRRGLTKKLLIIWKKVWVHTLVLVNCNKDQCPKEVVSSKQNGGFPGRKMSFQRLSTWFKATILRLVPKKQVATVQE